MSERRTDALELLLPDAAPQFWQRAQKVTTFLRLLSDDGRASGGASIGVDLAKARGEFERSALARLVRVHEELLRHHLYALVGPDSFLHLGECEGPLQRAWSDLEEERAEADWLPHVPAPGEAVLATVRRLIDGLERSGAGELRTELWRARLARAAEGPAAGERAHEELLARAKGRDAGAAAPAPTARPPRAPRASGASGSSGASGASGASSISGASGAPGMPGTPSPRAQALAGLVECLLDRAAVRAARARLEEDGARALADPRLRRLALWTRALCGDDAGARGLQAGLPHARTRLPRPLAELRARVPARAAFFSGVPAAGEALFPVPHSGPSGDQAPLSACAASARAHVGAALFAAWSLVGPARARLVAHAVAPAHAGRFRAWRDARDGAAADPREPECQMQGDGRARIAHFGGQAGPAREAIDPGSILATALVPVAGADGDVRGWLQFEFDHHLVPSLPELERLARAWLARLSARAAPGVALIPRELECEPSIASAVLRGFVDGLSLKTSQRRWSAFDVREDGVVLVARGGGGFDGGEPAEAGGVEDVAAGEHARVPRGRAVARAIASGQSVAFDDADPRLALHREAASGVAVPLLLRGRVAGVWLVESRRRRDFSAADVARFEARARSLAPELLAAQFRAWHVARFGQDLHVETGAPVAGLTPEQLVALAVSRAPVALSGPLGSGRRTLARRLHFESGRRNAALLRAGVGSRELELLFDAAGPAGAAGIPGAVPHGIPEGIPGAFPDLVPDWIVEGVLQASRADQLRLARRLEDAGPACPRVFVLLEIPVASALEQQLLAPELAWLVSRIELQVAPLARRRREIVPLARLFAAHFAAQEGVRTPELDDSARACLWRQAWVGNVRELGQWMYRLVLCHSGGVVDARELEALAERFGQTLQRRLPSRHPDRELLEAALETTAAAKGTPNKTRAALYLGWDTDTLQNRMQEAGLAPPPEESAPVRGAVPPDEA